VEEKMKRKHIGVALALIAVVAAVIVSWPNKTNALWGNTMETQGGLVIDFKVYGYSSGQPIAGVLTCYKRGGKNIPKFKWSSTTRPDGTHEFLVAGKAIPKHL